MDMTTLARPYAKAAFAIAQQDQSVAMWRDVLKVDREIILSSTLMAALEAPEASMQQKLAVFDGVLKQFDFAAIEQKHCNFLKTLISHHRLNTLPDVYLLFKRYAAKAEGIVNVRIDTAAPLAEADRQALEASLADKFGKAIKPSYMEKSNLLGGAVVKTASWVLDGSIDNLLTRLKDSLINER